MLLTYLTGLGPEAAERARQRPIAFFLSQWFVLAGLAALIQLAAGVFPLPLPAIQSAAGQLRFAIIWAALMAAWQVFLVNRIPSATTPLLREARARSSNPALLPTGLVSEAALLAALAGRIYHDAPQQNTTLLPS